MKELDTRSGGYAIRLNKKKALHQTVQGKTMKKIVCNVVPDRH